MKARGGRIPSLDGMRAIAILPVLYGHLEGTHGFTPVRLTRWTGDIAYLGVTVFFVISGFLITSLLMSERQTTGAISLKAFYLRRALRIFPAFYVFILALVIADRLGAIRLSVPDLAYSVTYTVNYYAGRSWNVGHLWSLSVEEQFYLLWPLLFAALRERRAFIAAAVAFLAGPFIRAAMHVAFPPPSPLGDLEIFPATADSIAIGCMLALLRPWLIEQRWYIGLTGRAWLAPVLVVSVVLINRQLDYLLVEFVGTPIMLIAIAVLVESGTRHADSLAGRFLNARPVAFIGVLSYSLYLWQQPFLNRHAEAPFTTFPQNLGLAFAAALLSYFLIERPLLGLRKRLERAPVLPERAEGIRVASSPTSR